MKKYLSLAGALLIAVLFVSCEKDLFVSTPKVVTVLNASVDNGEDTRSFLDEEGNIEWNEGDAITVFVNGSKYTFTSDSEGLSSNFSHEGDSEVDLSGEYYALSPANEDASISGSVITTTIPSEQVAVAGSFAQNANVAVGYANGTDKISFKNAVAYVKVGFKTTATAEQAKIKKLTFKSLDESVLLSGTATLSSEISDNKVSNVTTTVTTGVPYASVVASSGYLTPGVDYYIVAAPAALTGGFEIILTDEDGVSYKNSYDSDVFKSASLKRNTIAPVGKANLDNFSFEGYWRVKSTEDFTAGDYLIVKNMGTTAEGATKYRIFDAFKTEIFAQGGQATLNEFGSNMLTTASAIKKWQNGDIESPDFMKHFVLYTFKDAYVDSDSADDVTYSSDDLILTQTEDYKINLDESKTATVPLYYTPKGTTARQFKSVYLNNCVLSLDEDYTGTITGTIEPTSASSLVDVLWEDSFGDSMKSALGVLGVTQAKLQAAAQRASTGKNVNTVVGFCSEEQTTAGGTSLVDIFMLNNRTLCSTPTPTNISFYKFGTGTMTFAEFRNIQ